MKYIGISGHNLRGELEDRADASQQVGRAAWALAYLLARRGDLEELRARTDAGDVAAAPLLADLLAERGDVDELRARADVGDVAADRLLADLLAERGDVDELRARTDAGDKAAAELLANLLTKQGQGKEAERLRRFGLAPDGSIARA